MYALSLASTEAVSFDVCFASNLTHADNKVLQAALAGRRALLVTTPTVARLYGDRTLPRHPDLRVAVLALSERTKAIEAVLDVCRLAQELKLDRRSVLVAFGGGVCSDVVGFAASMIRRGITHIRVPTTLVGQIDAGVGLKTGVNFCAGKNYLGSFHPPERVLVDPTFLGTLPARELRQGLAEMVKIALVRDPALFATLEEWGLRLLESRFRDPAAVAEHAIHRSVALMLTELGANPFENRTLERLVDMGHTISPELESASGFMLPHGEAVAVDIALTCALGVELRMLDEEDAQRTMALLERLGLPTDHELLDAALCRRALQSAALHRGGRLNLVVPTAIGSADFVRDPAVVTDEILERGIRRLRAMPAAHPWDLAPAATRRPHAAVACAGA